MKIISRIEFRDAYFEVVGAHRMEHQFYFMIYTKGLEI